MNTSPPSGLSRAADRYKTWDQRRNSFPAEHWIVLCAGLALLLASRRSASPLVRAASSAAGSALLYRAASGRDGVSKLLRYLPLTRGLLKR
jgi:uncharacterized membrane protein